MSRENILSCPEIGIFFALDDDSCSLNVLCMNCSDAIHYGVFESWFCIGCRAKLVKQPINKTKTLSSVYMFDIGHQRHEYEGTTTLVEWLARWTHHPEENIKVEIT